MRHVVRFAHRRTKNVCSYTTPVLVHKIGVAADDDVLMAPVDHLVFSTVSIVCLGRLSDASPGRGNPLVGRYNSYPAGVHVVFGDSMT